MLLGIWKNIKELEEEICLAELELLLSAAREKESRHNKFMAAVQGVNLDGEEQVTAFDRVEEIKRRVESEQTGNSDEQRELEDLGFGYASE